MRQVILDTETTGLKPSDGHRIIEIGCVELINRRLTKKTYHQYINPEREVDPGAFRIHGLSNDFLSDKPLISEVVEEFLAFVEGSELVIHNAPFDVGFINHEFKLLGNNIGKIEDKCTILDTLALARRMHPGQRNSLDALCKRYAIDNTSRDLHGALLDSEILAQVYLAMTSGQDTLFIDGRNTTASNVMKTAEETQTISKDRPPLPVIMANEEELDAHQKLMEKIAAIREKNKE